MVSSGEGRGVGMVEWKKCSWEVNGWVGLLKEYEELLGVGVYMKEVLGKV